MDFVPELDRCADLAAHDEIGMRLEDRKQLLRNRQLFAADQSATSLVHDATTEADLAVDLRG